MISEYVNVEDPPPSGGGVVGGLFEVLSWYLPKAMNGRDETLVRKTVSGPICELAPF